MIAPELVNELVAAMRSRIRDASETERVKCLDALRELGPKAQAATDELRGSLTNRSETEMQSALRAVAAIGPSASALVPQVMTLATDGDDRTREAALRTLGALGAAAEPAVEMLTRLLDPASDIPAPTVRGQRPLVVATPVATSIPGHTLAAPPTAMLHTPGMVRRRLAANSLVAILRASPRVIPKFREILENPREESYMRVRALEAVCCGATDSKVAVDRAVRVFESGDEFLDLAAIAILGELAPKTPSAVDALLSLLARSREFEFEVRPRLDLGMGANQSQSDPEVRVRLALLGALASVAARPDVRQRLTECQADLSLIDGGTSTERRPPLREALRQRRDQRMMIERLLGEHGGTN
ncbi:MAG: hypothetical protein EHM42_05150 [Planctomycetaceae bacterium]|nr:MAG: hypothetical protein EHM42_05150 [Planctomycetaceae bacterium]